MVAKKKSHTIDNAFIYNGISEKYKAAGQQLCVCYVNLMIAFNYINRNAHSFTGMWRDRQIASYTGKHVFKSQKLC